VDLQLVFALALVVVQVALLVAIYRGASELTMGGFALFAFVIALWVTYDTYVRDGLNAGLGLRLLLALWFLFLSVRSFQRWRARPAP
jgi:hypothetical protein